MRLIKPTKANVRKYYRKHYDNNSEFTQLYRSISALVSAYPSHNKYAHVLPKAIVINQLYSTNIMAIKQMARHITQLELRTLIRVGDISAVPLITKGHKIFSRKKDKEYEFYSFATKYCHSHNPACFPIYDRYVDYILWEYQKKEAFSKFKRNELKKYDRFIEVLKDFKKYYKLGKMSTNTLDKFLWKQGERWHPR